jgi:large subunit ribosomal protein L9
MKLLLIKEVPGLGKPGDLVTVSAGYARNFLLPRNLAADPTPQAMRRVEAGKRKIVREVEDLKKQGEEVAKSLENCSVNITAKAGEGGHLFGSVSAADITQALAADGRKVEEAWLVLERPIKEVGIYDVPVIVHGETRATIKVWVVEAKEKD